MTNRGDIVPKIYCVEDDENIRQLIVYALNNNGYEALGFKNSEDFYSMIDTSIPDLVLLDIMLPGDDGLKILEKLRSNSKTRDIPVIMVSAKSSEFDKIKGLDQGADDYVTKPFGVMELISRVKALLRRTSVSNNSTNLLSLNNIIIDYEKRTVTIPGESIKLTYKEFELLYYLFKNQDIVLTRDKIMNEVWGFDFQGETRTVDVHIGTLRQKLGDYGSVIETIRNVGYKVGEQD